MIIFQCCSFFQQKKSKYFLFLKDISGRKPVVCQFSSNIDNERHKKTEAILLEGKYWKRRADVVKAEYNKWRLYYQHLSRSVAAVFSKYNHCSNSSPMVNISWFSF